MTHTHAVPHGVAEPSVWCLDCAAATVTPEGEAALTRWLERRVAEHGGIAPEGGTVDDLDELRAGSSGWDDPMSESVVDPLSSRRVVEWDWVLIVGSDRLHAPARWDDPAYDAYDDEGATVCGKEGWLSIPGLVSRMGTPRCARCCRLTGFPRGKGSPKNDDDCRPMVQARLKVLGLQE